MHFSDLWTPFVEYAFMQRALLGCLALSLASGPLGVFLVLRRMSLIGDALSHGLLPGLALGFLLCGPSLLAMGIGGFVAALCIALAAGAASRLTVLEEDASFAAFYLMAMAFGVFILSTSAQHLDLNHILFGSVLAMDSASLRFVWSVSSFSLAAFLLMVRPLTFECFDAPFFASISRAGPWVHAFFLMLVALNLVAAFQTLGTLMALGLFLMPAIVLRLWSHNLWILCIGSSVLAFVASWIGLLLSYYWHCPSGPSIILVLGVFYLFSLVPHGKKWVGLCACCVCLCMRCSNRPSEKTKNSVVVTFTILEDVVQNLVKGVPRPISVVSLVGRDGDPHGYVPTPQDCQRLQDAKMVVMSGFGLEGWMTRLIKAARSQALVVVASEGIVPQKQGKALDPHVWHSVPNVRVYARRIYEGLRTAFPNESAALEQAFLAYDHALEILDQEVRLKILAVQKAKRCVVTTHDAFGYFGAEYGMTFFSPLGLMPSAEIVPEDLIKLFASVKQRGVRAFFLENIPNPTLLKRLFSEVENKSIVFGGPLYSDSLSDACPTYLEMMRHNTEKLVEGMGWN